MIKKIIFLVLLFGVLYPYSLAQNDLPEALINDPKFDINNPEVIKFINQTSEKFKIAPAEIEKVIRKSNYIQKTIDLTTPKSSGGNIGERNWKAYRSRFITPRRINVGLDFIQKYAGDFAKAEKNYGVPKAIIASILNIETRFGENTGSFNVRDVLATLAFHHPTRKSFFQNELAVLISLANKNHYNLDILEGSFAGAIGLGQFIPSSIVAYATDFNGDGVIDLDNPTDAIGSIANYLLKHGWNKELRLNNTFIVITEKNIKEPEKFSDIVLTLKDQGVKPTISYEQLLSFGFDEKLLTNLTPPFTLVNMPLGKVGGVSQVEYRLANNNFYVVTRYNRSYDYAGVVVEYAMELERRLLTP